ncbi:MAG TPA: hypothetical protein PK765_03100 [bacterium]|nr:hypothetical protein [bacterium]
MLLGSGFDGDFDGIRKYVNRTFLEHMDIIRKMPYEERGAIPSLILNIVENLIDIHDSNAMNFVMHDKKEDVERLLLECVVNATKELGRELLSILSSVRDLFERTVGANHAAELATISGRVKRAMESLVEKYEYDPEIENNIELFRIDMQRLRSRL